MTVVLLPGLGADERLFAAQRDVLPDLSISAWLPPQPKEGLAEYGARLAGEVPTARPLVLGGCSFGGMVACEMARTVKPDALVLIGSAATSNEIPAYLRAVAGLARVVPTSAYRLARLAPPLIGHLFGARDRRHRRLFVDMLRATPPEFLRWAFRAINGWTPESPPDVPTFAIHGGRDRILPLGRREVDVVLPGAGHLLTLTHPEEVNAFLMEIRQRVCGDT